MRYARCKCGEYESWNSGMPTYPCQGCRKCNTTPAGSPQGHKDVVPHIPEKKYTK